MAEKRSTAKGKSVRGKRTANNVEDPKPAHELLNGKSTGNKLKVFLCHASEDKPKVRELYEHLVADSYDVWLDEKRLLAGQDWEYEIQKAVQASDIIIVCLSQNSSHKDGYVQKEIRIALDIADKKAEGTIYIIPARFVDCDVPTRLEKWQWVNLFAENGYRQLKNALDKRLQDLKQQINDQSKRRNLESGISMQVESSKDEKEHRGGFGPIDSPQKTTSTDTVGQERVTFPAVQPAPKSKRKVVYWVLITILVFAFLITAPLIRETFLLWKIPCSLPLQDGEILIRPDRDVKLVSDSWFVGTTSPGVAGMLHPQGSIELSGLDSEKSYFITLNGKPGYLPNIELRKIDQTWKWTEGYWDFMTVTANSIGTVSDSYLLGTLPPNVRLCSGQKYRAEFFVKDATHQTILGTNDFSFKVESSDSIPYALNIDISSTDMPVPISTIRMTNTTPPPTDLSLKGDSLVTVNIKTLNPSGVEISSDTLNYHWELCCDDNQNKTPDDSRLPVWKFKPPTYIPTETLTITVSNAEGYSVEVEIPFKIVPRY